MTALTITTSAPAGRLRRLPVPVSEPRPALRVIRDDEAAGSPSPAAGQQQCLHLTVPGLRLVPENDSPLPGDGSSPDHELGGAPEHGTAGLRRRPGQPAAARVSDPALGPSARTRRDLLLRQHQESLRPGIRRAAARSYDDVDDFCAPVATPSSQLPDPTRWAGQFVQAAVEVALGQRPVSQLVRWTSEDVHLTLSRRAQLAQRAGERKTAAPATAGRRAPRPRVQSVRGCTPRDGVVEATVVINDSVRTRAVAVRLEGWDGRWRVTALQLG